MHGAIAEDLAEKLGKAFSVFSQGYGKGKEAMINGKYFDKRADITITKDGKTVGGIAVKFVMQNYSQNSNNYFENMLGETANIRSNNCPYFQIFIVLDKLPYYRKDKTISKWETFTEHYAKKYMMLSNDSTERFLHTPNKTLICVVHIPDNDSIGTLQEYMDFYKRKDFRVEVSDKKYDAFGDAVILNDYEKFREKVYHSVMAL